MGRLLSDALQDFSRGFVSLENYKLDTDPDYTLAFQRAIDDLPESTPFESGGGIIMLDGKDYDISGTITIAKSIKIIGAGSDSGTRILLAANSDCDMFTIGIRNSSDPISVHLQGMRIQMNLTQTGTWNNIHCYNYLRHSHFIDLFLYGATGANFKMETDAEGGSPPRNSYFYGCAFEKGNARSVDIVHDYNLNINSCYFGFGADGQNSYGLYISMAADRFLLSNSWFLQDNRAGNIYLYGATSGHIVNNKFNGIDADAVANSSHIVLSNCSDINIGGNIFDNTIYPYGIRTLTDVDRVKIYDNKFGSVATAPFSFTDKDEITCHGNIFDASKRQENSGSATITDGNTYVEVTHNIFTTPDNVIATPQANESIWIDTIGATVFRINRAASTGDLICNWVASVGTY